MKIVVGMSGGVDSSVAALILKNQGHDVTGAIMKIWDPSVPFHNRNSLVEIQSGNACFGPDEEHDLEETRKVCGHLGIELREIDCSKEYRDIVLAAFKKEYSEGRTPNPCVLCNHEIKFGTLPRLLFSSGLSFEKFATGHYARLEQDAASGKSILMKALDEKKDQSYFLYRLSQEQLSRALFPLGNLTKGEVRIMAREAGLPVHDKEESQDFYSGEYSDLLDKPDCEGDIIDSQGKVLGKHRGTWNYTIGQRKGMGLTSPEPLYVIGIDAGKNLVIAGKREELFSGGLVMTDVVWTFGGPPEGTLSVKIRSASPHAWCRVTDINGQDCQIMFDEPLSAVTPGQSAVIYDGDKVLGGGIIKEAVK
jgi:tRNA-uridine 2-sulfurtransferase